MIEVQQITRWYSMSTSQSESSHSKFDMEGVVGRAFKRVGRHEAFVTVERIDELHILIRKHEVEHLFKHLPCCIMLTMRSIAKRALTWKFSLIRDAVTLFGIVTILRWMAQRRITCTIDNITMKDERLFCKDLRMWTCAGDLVYFSPIACSLGLSRILGSSGEAQGRSGEPKGL